MKNFSIALIFFSFVFSLYAQTVKVEKLEKLNIPGFENKAYYPVMSSDNKVYFTTNNYKGIYRYDLATRKAEIITEDMGAGYEFLVAPDNKTIIYRKDEYINNLKYSSIIQIELPKMTKSVLLEKNRFVSPAKLINANEIVTTVQASYRKVGTLKLQTAQKNVPKYYVGIDNQLIALYENGVKKTLDPLKVGNYVWPSVSPDNTKLLFVAVGEGTFITDLSGKVLHRLGYANAPVWSPDGKYVAYMVDEDDGHKLLRSNIYVVHVDSKKISLIAKDLKAMYPKFSPDGKNIVFNTEDGNVYIAKLAYSKN